MFSRKVILWTRVSQNGHFFTKNVEKWSPKITKIRFCYGKTLFAKCDKVAELTFFGADFQLLWSTLCHKDIRVSVSLVVFLVSPKKQQAIQKPPR